MKYGKNQWPRIASLLVRKSAKQCKARWYEWLDPSIKKTEWTREEEEKLLHLAKIMPTAWRTIAPMIGRTAAQCIEHYERLIDNARLKAAGLSGDGESALAAPLSRPPDAEAPPESKPARPDPVDMDEDELEMLTEARARLSNTKGKKAKRKAREKQLNDAKRLAQLQKIRELKAAGIPLKKPRRNKNAVDYATEIPFFREPAAGFYDTLEEDKRAEKLKKKNDQIGKLVQKYKEKGFEQIEEENRQKDNDKRKRVLAENPLVSLGLNRTQTFREPPLKKARFALPEPLLQDSELRKLSKSEIQPRLRASEVTQDGTRKITTHTVAPASESNFSSTKIGRASAQPWSYERDRRLQALVSVQSTQTPLYGGETPVADLELNGRATPTPSTFRTPNFLASPSVASISSVDESNVRRDAKRRAEVLKELGEMVRKGLMALPPPENEYELDFSSVSDDEAETEIEQSGKDDGIVEDAEEELARREEHKRKQVPLLRDRLLSSSAKRGLPLGNVKARNVDPCSIEFLMLRDNEVKRIVAEFERGERKAYEALNELRSLISTGESDDRDQLQKAQDMVNALVDEDGKCGAMFRVAIEEELRKSFDANLASALASSPSEETVPNGEDTTVEEVFRKETERRKKFVEDEVRLWGGLVVPKSEPFDLDKLRKVVDKSSPKGFGVKVRTAANIDDNILEEIEALWQRVGGK